MVTAPMSVSRELPGKYMRLGRRIAALRQAAGLTQRGLAEHMPASEGYLSRIEAGTARPRSDMLRRIAAILDADYTELAVLADYLPAQPADVQIIGQGERAGVLRGLLHLSADQLRALIRLYELHLEVFSHGEQQPADDETRRERRREPRDEEREEPPAQAEG